MTARLPRLMILLSEEMLAEIEDYCRTEPDIVFRTEAIRRLIRAGLDAVKGGATGLPGNRPNSTRARDDKKSGQGR